MTHWREHSFFSCGKDRSCNDDDFREELFYQLGLRQFGDFSRIKLDPPPSLRSMEEIAVNADDTTISSHLSRNQIAEVCHPVSQLKQAQ